MVCLINLEGAKRSEAKMELIERTQELMPAGKPQFLSVVKYPKISTLAAEHGKKKMIAVLTLMVKDFCSSINVVRNMNEDQMIEAGAMLLHECENFRIEDYVMMFAMAKRGSLYKIFDHLDIQIITEIMDAYWIYRHKAGKAENEAESDKLLQLGNPSKSIENLHVNDQKLIAGSDKLAGAIDALRSVMRDNSSDV